MFPILQLRSSKLRTGRLVALACVALVAYGAPLRAQQWIGVGLRKPVSRALFVPERENESASGSPAAGASTARKVVGAAIGIGLGGLAGYYLASATCSACDDSGPAWYGAIIGASLGGVLGVVTATSFGATTQRQASQYPLDTIQRLEKGDVPIKALSEQTLSAASALVGASARK